LLPPFRKGSCPPAVFQIPLSPFLKGEVGSYSLLEKGGLGWIWAIPGEKGIWSASGENHNVVSLSRKELFKNKENMYEIFNY
jgi:hypothetical protein